jgi:hypothetical protein
MGAIAVTKTPPASTNGHSKEVAIADFF